MIFEALFIIVIIFIFIILGVYIFSEIKINKLNNELEQKILKEKDRLAPMAFINGRIQKLKEEYDPEFKQLKWRRNFILGISSIIALFLSILSLFKK